VRYWLSYRSRLRCQYVWCDMMPRGAPQTTRPIKAFYCVASSVQTCIDAQVGYLPETAVCVKITELTETCQYHATETERAERALLCKILKACPHCRRKVRLSHESETVSLLWDSLTFLRQCGQAITGSIPNVSHFVKQKVWLRDYYYYYDYYS